MRLIIHVESTAHQNRIEDYVSCLVTRRLVSSIAAIEGIAFS
jgi:hypothetical protein